MIRSAVRAMLLGTRRIRYGFDRFTFERSGRAVRVRRLRGRHRGRPMLVVGNGPSLRETPLEAFVGVPSIGMNKINLLFPHTAWRPDYIVCTNNLVARQNETFYATTTIPVWLSWKCRLFLRRATNRNCEFFLSLATPEFSTDAARGLGSSATVTYAALQLAYYMGGDPVIILGVDHRFSLRGGSRSQDIERVTREDVNHFDPNYFAKGQLWGVPNLQESEVAYRAARAAFETDGRQVLDATIGGALRIFPRISLSEAQTYVAEGDE